jgi:alkanesulfonate monooxygenase SsuD/methylene tetrahydromethanopterin reductase-like flavin-dependent oxidoreductase (luciferase family)
MQLGFFTMPLHPPGSDLAQTLQDDLGQLVELDRLGYVEAWIGEHFTAEWENIPAPDLLIAQALGLTSQIKFGTGVTNIPNHNPFTLAHRIAQLDQMARGRLLWGIGSGGFMGDIQVAGIDPASGEHREMTRTAVDLILDLWKEPKPGAYNHARWRFNVPEPDDEIGLRVHVRPYQKPHPPIALAGISVKSDTLELAGERGWIPMSINFAPTRVLETHWESVATGAARSGVTADRADWRIARDIFVADSTKEARKQAMEGVLARDFDQYFRRLLPKGRGMGVLKQDPDMPDAGVTAEYMMDNVWIVGSREEVAEKLGALNDRVGGFGVLLAMGHEWEPRDAWADSMGMLMNDVMPKIGA